MEEKKEEKEKKEKKLAAPEPAGETAQTSAAVKPEVVEKEKVEKEKEKFDEKVEKEKPEPETPGKKARRTRLPKVSDILGPAGAMGPSVDPRDF